jgi:hypothetical protein
MTDKEFLKAVGITEFMPPTNVDNTAFLRFSRVAGDAQGLAGILGQWGFFATQAHLRTWHILPRESLAPRAHADKGERMTDKDKKIEAFSREGGTI